MLFFSFSFSFLFSSLGITCIELADMVPPLSDVHPMRAIFVIPKNPPPTLPNAEKYSQNFVDFVAKCVQKDEALRPTAKELCHHPFVREWMDKKCDCLDDLLLKYHEEMEKFENEEEDDEDDEDDEDEEDEEEQEENVAVRQPKQVHHLNPRVSVRSASISTNNTVIHTNTIETDLSAQDAPAEEEQIDQQRNKKHRDSLRWKVIAGAGDTIRKRTKSSKEQNSFQSTQNQCDSIQKLEARIRELITKMESKDRSDEGNEELAILSELYVQHPDLGRVREILEEKDWAGK